MSRKKFVTGYAPFITTLVAAALACAAPAQAQAQSLEALERRLEAMQAEIQALHREIAEVKAEAAEAQKNAAKAEKAAQESDITVKWKGAPEIASKDGQFSMKMRGRIQADAGFIDQDGVAPDVDRTEFRRARLGIEGRLYTDMKYRFEVDFADDDVEVQDAYLQFTGWPAHITLGQFKTPNSLEELTSSNSITFMERASITDAFELSRGLGAGASYTAERWTAAAGVFRGSSAADEDQDRDEGEVLAGRVTYTPILAERSVLHLGAHARYRETGDDQDLFRYRQRPHLHTTDDRFVRTDRIGEEDTLYGLEIAWVQGPFSSQAEYMAVDVDTQDGEDPTFDGWYVDASWFITGEYRPYKGGTFGGVKVKNPVFSGGLGAWQIAARFDTIDLDDEGTSGGEQDTWIVGVNWHLNDYMRFMLNYSRSDVDNGPDGDLDIDALGLRAQIDW